MRKLILMAGLIVVAIACGDAVGEMLDSGVPDAGAQPGDCPCEVGPQGEQGVPGVGAVVWVDADGAIVDRMIGMKDYRYRYYFDLDGNVWSVTSTDELTVTDAGWGSGLLFYSTPDCTGTAYLLSGLGLPFLPLPRMTFTIPSDPDIIRVRPDRSATQVFDRCSTMTEEGCVPMPNGCSTGNVGLVAGDTVPKTPLSIPTLSHARPSHPELR